ncbi:hypothetical protein PAECIP112173_01924 [Paenibacillus sp. JJ-100]|nr:hypothetical protein PAECIP112173_01924 [Paenibacillus sp. JJ-100]
MRHSTLFVYLENLRNLTNPLMQDLLLSQTTIRDNKDNNIFDFFWEYNYY